jgi:hypothetical protein
MEETDMCCPSTLQAARHLEVAPPCIAQTLALPERLVIAVSALAGVQTISGLADEYGVSRKFIYGLAATAQQAVEEALDNGKTSDDEVLFYLPVTKAWIKQCVLGLVLICHSSVRGVVEFLGDLLDYSISVGTVHNIVHGVVASASQWNTSQDLSTVGIGAHDELFQKMLPVLVGIDTASTYCYLLSLQEHRDAQTWAVRLLELQDRGFAPEAIIADFGSGLRAGQELALPGVPCWGDTFHAVYEAGAVVTALDNRAYQALTVCYDLENKSRQHEKRNGRRNLSLAQKLRSARQAAGPAVTLADDVRWLVRWLRQDVLVVTGPDLATRCELYDFIVAELQDRKHLCSSRLAPLCTLLVNQRDNLLAFAGKLDQELCALGQEFEVAPEIVRKVLQVEALAENNPRRWPQQAALQNLLGSRYHPLSLAVQEVREHTVRASSAVENLNGRLRNYFFLRRTLGPEYLSLLQFFLNHRRFQRSEHPERAGKSPVELLTGEPQQHWLEKLGFQPFSRN